jgi:hypothetical protein
MLPTLLAYVRNIENTLEAGKNKGFFTAEEIEELSTSAAVLTGSFDYWLTIKGLLDQFENKIAFNSPLGRSLFHHGKDWMNNPVEAQMEAKVIRWKIEKLKAEIKKIKAQKRRRPTEKPAMSFSEDIKQGLDSEAAVHIPSNAS